MSFLSQLLRPPENASLPVWRRRSNGSMVVCCWKQQLHFSCMVGLLVAMLSSVTGSPTVEATTSNLCKNNSAIDVSLESNRTFLFEGCNLSAVTFTVTTNQMYLEFSNVSIIIRRCEVFRMSLSSSRSVTFTSFSLSVSDSEITGQVFFADRDDSLRYLFDGFTMQCVRTRVSSSLFDTAAVVLSGLSLLNVNMLFDNTTLQRKSIQLNGQNLTAISILVNNSALQIPIDPRGTADGTYLFNLDNGDYGLEDFHLSVHNCHGNMFVGNLSASQVGLVKVDFKYLRRSINVTVTQSQFCFIANLSVPGITADVLFIVMAGTYWDNQHILLEDVNMSSMILGRGSTGISSSNGVACPSSSLPLQLPTDIAEDTSINIQIVYYRRIDSVLLMTLYGVWNVTVLRCRFRLVASMLVQLFIANTLIGHDGGVHMRMEDTTLDVLIAGEGYFQIKAFTNPSALRQFIVFDLRSVQRASFVTVIMNRLRVNSSIFIDHTADPENFFFKTICPRQNVNNFVIASTNSLVVIGNGTSISVQVRDVTAILSLLQSRRNVEYAFATHVGLLNVVWLRGAFGRQPMTSPPCLEPCPFLDPSASTGSSGGSIGVKVVIHNVSVSVATNLKVTAPESTNVACPGSVMLRASLIDFGMFQSLNTTSSHDDGINISVISSRLSLGDDRGWIEDRSPSMATTGGGGGGGSIVTSLTAIVLVGTLPTAMTLLAPLSQSVLAITLNSIEQSDHTAQQDGPLRWSQPFCSRIENCEVSMVNLRCRNSDGASMSSSCGVSMLASLATAPSSWILVDEIKHSPGASAAFSPLSSPSRLSLLWMFVNVETVHSSSSSKLILEAEGVSFVPPPPPSTLAPLQTAFVAVTAVSFIHSSMVVRLMDDCVAEIHLLNVNMKGVSATSTWLVFERTNITSSNESRRLPNASPSPPSFSSSSSLVNTALLFSLSQSQMSIRGDGGGGGGGSNTSTLGGVMPRVSLVAVNVLSTMPLIPFSLLSGLHFNISNCRIVRLDSTSVRLTSSWPVSRGLLFPTLLRSNDGDGMFSNVTLLCNTWNGRALRYPVETGAIAPNILTGVSGDGSDILDGCAGGGGGGGGGGLFVSRTEVVHPEVVAVPAEVIVAATAILEVGASVTIAVALLSGSGVTMDMQNFVSILQSSCSDGGGGGGGIMRFLLSPFYDLGPIAVVAGNAGLALGFWFIHAVVLATRSPGVFRASLLLSDLSSSRRNNPTNPISRLFASLMRCALLPENRRFTYPNHSLRFATLLLAGVAQSFPKVVVDLLNQDGGGGAAVVIITATIALVVGVVYFVWLLSCIQYSCFSAPLYPGVLRYRHAHAVAQAIKTHFGMLRSETFAPDDNNHHRKHHSQRGRPPAGASTSSILSSTSPPTTMKGSDKTKITTQEGTASRQGEIGRRASPPFVLFRLVLQSWLPQGEWLPLYARSMGGFVLNRFRQTHVSKWWYSYVLCITVNGLSGVPTGSMIVCIGLFVPMIVVCVVTAVWLWATKPTRATFTSTSQASSVFVTALLLSTLITRRCLGTDSASSSSSPLLVTLTAALMILQSITNVGMALHGAFVTVVESNAMQSRLLSPEAAAADHDADANGVANSVVTETSSRRNKRHPTTTATTTTTATASGSSRATRSSHTPPPPEISLSTLFLTASASAISECLIGYGNSHPDSSLSSVGGCFVPTTEGNNNNEASLAALIHEVCRNQRRRHTCNRDDD